jgi:hypothetical protein
MNSAKKNYTTIEKEDLAMIYVVKKFRHYLLGNSFFLCRSSSITISSEQTDNNRSNYQMVLLLQKFNFKVVYKPGQVHFLLDHMSKISHGEPTKGVDDLLPNVHLFNVGVDWYVQS